MKASRTAGVEGLRHCLSCNGGAWLISRERAQTLNPDILPLATSRYKCLLKKGDACWSSNRLPATRRLSAFFTMSAFGERAGARKALKGKMEQKKKGGGRFLHKVHIRVWQTEFGWTQVRKQ